MKRDTNHVIVIGRLTADVKMDTLPTGTAKASFSIANNYGWKDTQKVNFFDVVFLGKIAEVCGNWLSKGKQVLVEGEVRQDRWQDKESGKNRSRVYIFGTSMQMLGSKSGTTDEESAPPRGEEESAPSGNETPPTSTASEPVADDDSDSVPF
jgi:single-strand DNA-binding protein